jgi:hypothetical protein
VLIDCKSTHSLPHHAKEQVYVNKPVEEEHFWKLKHIVIQFLLCQTYYISWKSF